MPSPVEEIAADATTMAPVPGAEGGVQSPAPSRAMEALRRLIQPSPRSLEELQGDLVATLVNTGLDDKTKSGASSQSQLGESVADCIYALTGASGGIGGESPIMRLLRSVVRFFGFKRKPKEGSSAS